MYNQKQLSQPSLPPYVPEHTRKDKLYNDVLRMLESRNLKFPSTIVNSTGKNFVKTIVDCLWYIDGHHDSLKKQSCHVPSDFSQFVGYNCPELSKHRKRQAGSVCHQTLRSLSSSLFLNLQILFWQHDSWLTLRNSIQSLAVSLADYAEYLSSKNKTMTIIHARATPVWKLSDSISVKYIPACESVVLSRLHSLSQALQQKDDYEHIFLNNSAPDQPRKKYEYIQTLANNGVCSSIVLFTHSSGNNSGNLNFVWKASSNVEESFDRSVQVIEEIKPLLPVFHTRAMRKMMFEKFGRISPSVKPAVLRYFYRDLTGDCSASHDLQESIIDQRVQEIIQMEPEDLNTVVDLQTVKQVESRTKFDTFWSHARLYINEDLGAAVDDRRHGEVTHLAKAISVLDLRQQVASRCPEGTAIPSEEWLRLQFWPKTPHAKVSLHYTGSFNVRFMVQKRQFRKYHEDQHYCAAIFRYLREYAIQLKEYSTMLCIDDKHKLKIGEPGFPVAAAERGRRVLVRSGTYFEVGDHDFTKSSMTPSVAIFQTKLRILGMPAKYL